MVRNGFKKKSEVTRHGIWAIENPDTFGDARKADFNKIKAEQSVDSFLQRDAYGHFEDMRRHNIAHVVWYTGNLLKVLKDKTGNRRYIIAYSIGPIDEDWLRLNADQWWAQIYEEMGALRSNYLEAQRAKGINDDYPKYLELPRDLWKESKKRSDAAMVDASSWVDWLPEIIFQDFVVWSHPKSNKHSIMVLTRDVLRYLHEKSPRNIAISEQDLSIAMTDLKILSKEECKDLSEDIRWVSRQIRTKGGGNLRGYRIDFLGDLKKPAFEMIKQMVATERSSTEAYIDQFKSQEKASEKNNQPF